MTLFFSAKYHLDLVHCRDKTQFALPLRLCFFLAPLRELLLVDSLNACELAEGVALDLTQHLELSCLIPSDLYMGKLTKVEVESTEALFIAFDTLPYKSKQ